ncbi:MAG TPA: High-affinity nickel transporter [Thermoanaerobaculia bacterium]|nr:High-affinity nickel transporter [Thermoanaerobaculia bacterium]
MEMPVLLAGSAGLLAGFVHALAGPDHLSAVAPLVVQEPRRRWRMGLFWGIGHSLGVWAVGLLALGLRGIFPVESVSSWSERLVGVMLIGLGLWGLHRAFASRLSRHPHEHEDGPKKRPGRAAVWIGSLHGLAGSSHLLGVLPALALPSSGAALSYVAGFGLGAVAAMTAFSSALGLVAARITARGGMAYQALLGSFSAAAIVIGGYWLIS